MKRRPLQPKRDAPPVPLPPDGALSPSSSATSTLLGSELNRGVLVFQPGIAVRTSDAPRLSMTDDDVEDLTEEGDDDDDGQRASASAAALPPGSLDRFQSEWDSAVSR